MLYISCFRFSSRCVYILQKFNVGSITFATAQAACASYGGTLAIFPSANEMDTLWDILSMDLKMSADKIQSHRYWVGLKYHNTSQSGGKCYSLWWSIIRLWVLVQTL